MRENWKQICCTLNGNEIRKFDDWISGYFSRNEALKVLIAIALDSQLAPDKYIQFLKMIPDLAMVEARTTAGESRLNLARQEIRELQEQRMDILSDIESLKKTEKEIFKRIARGIPIGPAIPLPVIPIVSIQKAEEVVEKVEEDKKEEAAVEEAAVEEAAVEIEKKTPMRLRISSG